GLVPKTREEFVVELRQRVRFAATRITKDPDMAREDGVNADTHLLSWLHCKHPQRDGRGGVRDEGVDRLELVVFKEEALIVEQRHLPDTTMKVTVFEVTDETHLEFSC